jgi:hypothetical protein
VADLTNIRRYLANLPLVSANNFDLASLCIYFEGNALWRFDDDGM